MGLSGVMRLKPEICGSIDTITDSVELCDSTNGSLAQSNYNTTLSELDVDTNGLWMTVFGSIIIQTTGLLRTAFGHQEMVIQHTCFDEEQSIDYYYTDYKLMILMLKRVPSLPNTVQESPLKLLPHNTSSLLSFLSCINSIDTAPPPHDWFTGACHTAPLPSTGNGSLVCISPEPLSDSGSLTHSIQEKFERNPPGKRWEWYRENWVSAKSKFNPHPTTHSILSSSITITSNYTSNYTKPKPTLSSSTHPNLEARKPCSNRLWSPQQTPSRRPPTQEMATQAVLRQVTLRPWTSAHTSNPWTSTMRRRSMMMMTMRETSVG
ncbi:hypothetical protein NDA17_000593 [Ustilago hordei]|nr:hypothetical protein NDA17_000593 [Ustilago hordei]